MRKRIGLIMIRAGQRERSYGRLYAWMGSLIVLGCVSVLGADLVLKTLDLGTTPDAVTRATPGYKLGLKPPHLRAEEKRPPFMVVDGVVNLALYKNVTADKKPTSGELEQITDGLMKCEQFDYVEGPSWIQIDLEKKYALQAIVLWHYYKHAVIFNDVIVQVADNPEFTENVRTLYNNDHDNSSGMGKGKDTAYVSRWWGEIVDARGEGFKGTAARCVRVYTAVGMEKEVPSYVEVAVYGK